MKLEKLILINWGFVVSQEYLFGDATLLSGSTGVGKSSFQDAIQLVMTGGKHHINVFNSAQDEAGRGIRAGGKIRRTLASYALGMRDNLCARPNGSHTYVAAVFAPEPHETASAFTAIVAVEAQVSGTREQGRNPQIARRQFLIVPGVIATENDFITLRKGSSIDVVLVEQLNNHLRLRYSKVLAFDNIEDYLCKLYASFRGGSAMVGPREAEAAARAFVQSIARKTVGSVDELIREQVLDEPDFTEQIGHISSLMQNVQRLREIAASLQAARERLAQLKLHADDFVSAFDEALAAELGEAVRRRYDAERKIDDLRRDQTAADADAKRNRALAQRHKLALGRANEHLSTAKGRLNGNPVAVERERIDREITNKVEQRTGVGVRLVQAIVALRSCLTELSALADRPNREQTAYKEVLDRVVVALPMLGLSAARESADRLVLLVQQPKIDPVMLDRERFSILDDALTPLIARIHEGEDGLYAQAMLERAKLQGRTDTLDDDIRDLNTRKQGLDEGRMDLPQGVQLALRFLQEKYPASNPRVLCNLVQPRNDSTWQNAIEGLLGGNRYLLIVEPDYEARAIRAVRHELPAALRTHRRGDSEASVMQGELARSKAGHLGLAAESILHELKIEDETAYAYLLASYGRYHKVTDESALRKTAQGLTVDGMASGNFKMFTAWAEDGDLAFGAEARRKRAVKLGRDAEEKSRDKSGLEAQIRSITAWIGKLQLIQHEPILPMLDELAEIQRGFNGLIAAREALDESGLAGLERRVARAQKLYDGHLTLMSNASDTASKAEGRAEVLGTDISEAETASDGRQCDVDRVLGRLDELVRLNPQQHRDDRIHQATEMACGENGQTAEQFDGRKRQQTGRYREHREAFERQIEEHNRLASSLEEKVSYEPQYSSESEHEWWAYGGILQSRKQIAAMLARLDEVRILRNTTDLENAEEGFNGTFTSSFAFAVRTAVEQGIQPLKRLNEKLKRLAFGEDRFEIEYGQMVKEYKQYYDLFLELNRLAETQTPVDLFTESASGLSHENVTTLDEIKNLLLNPNKEIAQRRLRDIADYRNYRHYDIRKYSEDGREASLAKMATFSGGELMTPAYLVRAAVLAQAFRQFEKTASLKLMMIDEAFDKMDEARTASVMRYLNENLGLQLIVAMPTRSSGPLIDLFTFEHRFSLMKVAGLAGELDKITEVDSSLLKTDRLREMWSERRRVVKEKAEEEFILQEARQQVQAEGHP